MKLERKDHKRKMKTSDAFKSEVNRWAEKINVTPEQIRIQTMKKKWASCSSRERICFSKDLLNEPQDFQKYVIVHELLHLQVPNHGKLFKSLMNAYLPEWEKIVGRRRKESEREI